MPCCVQAELIDAVKGVISQGLEVKEGTQEWGRTWLERLSHDHPTAPADSGEGGHQ